MGIYLLAGIILVLFIVFLIDFIRDAKDPEVRDRNLRFPRYREEFGEDDLFSYDEYRYYNYYFNDEWRDEEGTVNESDGYSLNFKDEFGEEIMHDLPDSEKKENESSPDKNHA